MLTVWLHVWQLTDASNLINRYHPNVDPVLCQRPRRWHSTGSTLCWHAVLAVVPTRLWPVCRQCDKTEPLVAQTGFFNRLLIYSIESYLLDWKVQDWRCQSLIKSGGICRSSVNCFVMSVGDLVSKQIHILPGSYYLYILESCCCWRNVDKHTDWHSLTRMWKIHFFGYLLRSVSGCAHPTKNVKIEII